MNTPTLPVLTGTAVTLRPITDADTDLIVKWRNTQSVVQNFIFRQTFTPEMHRSWLATKVATGQVVQYTVRERQIDRARVALTQKIRQQPGSFRGRLCTDFGKGDEFRVLHRLASRKPVVNAGSYSLERS